MVKVGGGTMVDRRADATGKQFTVISWNACGLTEGAEKDIISLLEGKHFHWDVVLIQEGRTSEKEGSNLRL